MTSNEILSILSVLYDLDLPSTHFEAHEEEIIQDYHKLKQYKTLEDRDKWFLSWLNTYGYETFNLIDISLAIYKLDPNNTYISEKITKSIESINRSGSFIGMKAEFIRLLSTILISHLDATEGSNGLAIGIKPDYSIDFTTKYRIDNSSITNSNTLESKDLLLDYIYDNAGIILSKILSQYKWRKENNDLFNGYRIRMRDIYDYIEEKILGDTRHIILSTGIYLYNTDGKIISINKEVLEECLQASEIDRISIFLDYMQPKLRN